MKLVQYNEYLVNGTVVTDGLVWATRHQQLPCWVGTHAFPVVYGLRPRQIGNRFSNDISEPSLNIGMQKYRFYFNTLRLRKIGNHFADDIFNFTFLYEGFVLWFKLHWKLLPSFQLTIGHHWFW